MKKILSEVELDFSNFYDDRIIIVEIIINK